MLPLSGAPMLPLSDALIDAHRVGSSVTCDPIPPWADSDILCLVSNTTQFVEDSGYDRGGSDFRPHTDSKFISLKKDGVNLIVTDDKGFFDAFLLATHVAKTLNLRLKEHRICLFQAIIYSCKYEPKGLT